MPPEGPPAGSGQLAALNMRRAPESGANRMRDRTGSGTAVPKGAAHATLRECGGVVWRRGKQTRRKWARRERRRSSPARHADYGRLDGGSRFTSYMDGASRLTVRRRVFDEAASKRAVEAPDGANIRMRQADVRTV